MARNDGVQIDRMPLPFTKVLSNNIHCFYIISSISISYIVSSVSTGTLYIVYGVNTGALYIVSMVSL